jgi:uncharacterized radical SAM superfamily Fe-S cluster-containing enzyme
LREQRVSTCVDYKAVNVVGANHAAEAARALDQNEWNALTLQLVRRSEATDPASDDHTFDSHPAWRWQALCRRAADRFRQALQLRLTRAMALHFDDSPQRVYWELTRACDLACTHCRASANPCTSSRELRTLEIFRILQQLAAECTPHVILTGGDPLKRKDFFNVVKHTVGLGLPCLVAPSATPLLDSRRHHSMSRD